MKLTNQRVDAVMLTRDGRPRQDCWMSMLAAVRTASEGGHEHRVRMNPNHLSIAQNRNEVVQRFLYDTDYTHLMMVDDDVEIPPDAVVKLLECEADVASACVPMAWAVGMNPRIVLDVTIDGVTWEPDWFEGIIDIHSCGGGAFMVTRELMQRIEAPWFELPDHNPKLTEDVVFCERVRKLGDAMIRANGDVRCSHHNIFDLANALNKHSTWHGTTTVEAMKAWPTDDSYFAVLEQAIKSGLIKTALMIGGREKCANMLREADVGVLWAGPGNEMNDWPSRLIGAGNFQARVISDSTMPTFVRNQGADLIVVDCGDCSDHNKVVLRADIMAELCKEETGIVMLHDMQIPALRRAFHYSNFRSKRVFQPARGPATGLCSNQHDIAALITISKGVPCIVP